MSKQSLKDFVDANMEDDRSEKFNLENSALLEINLEERVWLKKGSMISYRGNINFEREGMFSGGLKKMFKKAISQDQAVLMKAEGSGQLYAADQGKEVSVIKLNNETLYVNGDDILAFEDSVDWNITMMKKISNMAAGGIFNVKLTGSGWVAITTHKSPFVMKVAPNNPVFTDPNATVAWSENLTTDFETNVSFKSMFRSSGESFQLKFSGDGFVVVQPFEEVYETSQ